MQVPYRLSKVVSALLQPRRWQRRSRLLQPPLYESPLRILCNRQERAVLYIQLEQEHEQACSPNQLRRKAPIDGGKPSIPDFVSQAFSNTLG